jgi:hypothetical protein
MVHNLTPLLQSPFTIIDSKDVATAYPDVNNHAAIDAHGNLLIGVHISTYNGPAFVAAWMLAAGAWKSIKKTE